MIVQPDFPEHHKTRLLVEITKDEASPMAVIRLWGYCQTSRKWEFPGMTPAQLASICRWGDRKPSCHVALVRAGFVDKLKPNGFVAHQWEEHNAKLLANWENGKKGGRPGKSENPNESGSTEKPMGSGGLPQTKPIDQIDQTRETRLDKPDQNRPDAATPLASSSPSPAAVGGDGSDSSVSGVGGLVGLVAGIASKAVNAPTLQQVRNYLSMAFNGADRFAESFHKAMTKQKWRDKDGKPLTNWQSVAKAYASSAALSGGKQRVNPRHLYQYETVEEKSASATAALRATGEIE